MSEIFDKINVDICNRRSCDVGLISVVQQLSLVDANNGLVTKTFLNLRQLLL